MATLYAQATGDCDSIAWNTEAGGGGSSVPWASQSATDDLIANGYTVALSSAANGFTRGSIQTNASGGGFTVSLASANYSFTADVTAGASTCLTTSGDGYVLTINGDVTGGTASTCYGVNPVTLSSTRLTVNGNVTGGSGASTSYGCARMANGATITINGNVLAGSAGIGVQVGYNANIIVSGDATASSAHAAIAGYSGYFVLQCGGSLICNANGYFPVMGGSSPPKIKLTGTGSGKYLSTRDGSLNELIMKVPDYPLEADVKSGTVFDYSTKTGTLAGGGGSCRIIGG